MDPFVSQIQAFAFNFAPQGWAQCNGQLMPIAQNIALFSLLSTVYGGDGSATYALPNLQGRAVSGQGQGPGRTPREQGAAFGSTAVTLLPNQLPSHTHTLEVFNQRDAAKRHASPSAGDALVSPTVTAFTTNNTPATSLFGPPLGPTGSNQAHENRQPYLALNFCIALMGVFPQHP